MDNTAFCSTCNEFKRPDEISSVGRPTCQDCGSPVDLEGNR